MVGRVIPNALRLGVLRTIRPTNTPKRCYNIGRMDNTNNLPTRKHLPHTPPACVSQYTNGALYFITICADRHHYGIIGAPMVGRVIPNAPNSDGGLRTIRPTNVDGGLRTIRPTNVDGGLRTTRPTNAPLLDNNNAIRLLFALEHYRTKGDLFPRLAVIMPDHIHVIASFLEAVVIAQLIRNWKRWTAKETGIVWQDGFFEHRLRNDAEVAEKLDYVANNPVRKGLCETAEAWPFRMSWC